MASKRAKKLYRAKQLPAYAEGGPIKEDPRYAANQVAGQGVVGRANAGRMAAIDVAENSALQQLPATTPTPASAPAPVAAPRKKFLGLFASGGPVGYGMRGMGFMSNDPWKKDASGNYTGTEWDMTGGSIIPQPGTSNMGTKFGSLVQDEDGGISLMSNPMAPQKPKAEEQKNFGLHFADGGGIKEHLTPSAMAEAGVLARRIAAGAAMSPGGTAFAAALHAGDVGSTTPVERFLSSDASRRQLRTQYPDQVSRGLRDGAGFATAMPMMASEGRFSGAGSSGRFSDAAPVADTGHRGGPEFSAYQELAQEMAGEGGPQAGRGRRSLRAAPEDMPAYDLPQKLAGFADGDEVLNRRVPLAPEVSSDYGYGNQRLADTPPRFNIQQTGNINGRISNPGASQDFAPGAIDMRTMQYTRPPVTDPADTSEVPGQVNPNASAGLRSAGRPRLERVGHVSDLVGMSAYGGRVKPEGMSSTEFTKLSANQPANMSYRGVPAPAEKPAAPAPTAAAPTAAAPAVSAPTPSADTQHITALSTTPTAPTAAPEAPAIPPPIPIPEHKRLQLQARAALRRGGYPTQSPYPPRGLADGGQIWGGPETDNKSTLIHAPIYKGPGGIWDGMPMFADGGGVAPARGHVTKLKKGEGALMYASGGQINRKGLRGGIKNGEFYGEGGPTQDKVHIRASPGEFIIPADSAEKIGMGKLRKMVAATHKPVHLNQGLRNGFANAGEVDAWGRPVEGNVDLWGRPIQGQPAPAPATPAAAVADAVAASEETPGRTLGERAGAARDSAGNVLKKGWNFVRHPLGGPPTPNEQLAEQAAQRTAHERVVAQQLVDEARTGRPYSYGNALDPVTGERMEARGLQRPDAATTRGGEYTRVKPLNGQYVPDFEAYKAVQDAELKSLELQGEQYLKNRVPFSEGSHTPIDRGAQTPLEAPNPKNVPPLSREETLFREAQAAGRTTPRGDIIPPRLERGLVGGALRGTAKALPYVGAGLEGIQAYGDIADPDEHDTDLKFSRGLESAAKLGLGTIGGIVGSAGGPPGAIVGSVALYESLPALEHVVKKLGGPSFLPSTIMEERRAGRAKTAAEAKKEMTPEQLAAYRDKLIGFIKSAQGGAYADSTDRRQQQLTGPKLPIAGRDDAADLVAPEGGGYISGTDPSGLRRLISYNDKNPMPKPYGATDTTSPEILAADKARRAGWVAQSQAIDEKNAKAADFERRSLRDMVTQNQQNTANYDMRQGLANRDPAAVAAAAGILGQVREGQNRQGILDAKAQEAASADARTKAQAEATRYAGELGLRGHQITADATLEGERLKAEFAARQAMLAQREKNLTNSKALVKDTFAQFKKEGDKTVPDPQASQAAEEDFRKWVRATGVNNPAFLAKFGKITDINDIPESQWEPLIQRYKTSRAIVGDLPVDSGDTPLEGLPQKVGTEGLRMNDWVNWRNEDKRNSIGFLENMWGMTGGINPWVTPDEQTVVNVGTQGSPTQRVLMKNAKLDTPSKRLEFIAMLERQGDKEGAKKMRAYWQMADNK